MAVSPGCYHHGHADSLWLQAGRVSSVDMNFQVSDPQVGLNLVGSSLSVWKGEELGVKRRVL